MGTVTEMISCFNPHGIYLWLEVNTVLKDHSPLLAFYWYVCHRKWLGEGVTEIARRCLALLFECDWHTSLIWAEVELQSSHSYFTIVLMRSLDFFFPFGHVRGSFLSFKMWAWLLVCFCSVFKWVLGRWSCRNLRGASSTAMVKRGVTVASHSGDPDGLEKRKSRCSRWWRPNYPDWPVWRWQRCTFTSGSWFRR